LSSTNNRHVANAHLAHLVNDHNYISTAPPIQFSFAAHHQHTLPPLEPTPVSFFVVLRRPDENFLAAFSLRMLRASPNRHIAPHHISNQHNHMIITLVFQYHETIVYRFVFQYSPHCVVFCLFWQTIEMPRFRLVEDFKPHPLHQSFTFGFRRYVSYSPVSLKLCIGFAVLTVSHCFYFISYFSNHNHRLKQLPNI
jgi:hypothetical protein